MSPETMPLADGITLLRSYAEDVLDNGTSMAEEGLTLAARVVLAELDRLGSVEVDVIRMFTGERDAARSAEHRLRQDYAPGTPNVRALDRAAEIERWRKIETSVRVLSGRLAGDELPALARQSLAELVEALES